MAWILVEIVWESIQRYVEIIRMWRQSEGYIFLTLLLTRPRSTKQFCGCLASAVEHFVHKNFELRIRASRSVGFASKGWKQCRILLLFLLISCELLISLVVVAVLRCQFLLPTTWGLVALPEITIMDTIAVTSRMCAIMRYDANYDFQHLSTY